MANMLDKRDRSMVALPNSQREIAKVDKYSWARPSVKGEFRWIRKELLNVDDTYQRDKVSEDKVRKMAAEWDWTLLEPLMVAERPDGSLWVYMGGHRVRSSFYRSDIFELPCMVFKLDDIASEARAFVANAKLTKSIGSLDTFRASHVAQEPTAVRTGEVLKANGIEVRKNASRPTEIKCVHTIQKAVAENEEMASRVLRVCASLTDDKPISSAVFRGIFRLAQHFNGKDVLTEYADRFAQLTQAEIEKSIAQFKAETGKGGEAIEAKGVLMLLNKHKKSRKLVW